MCITQIRENFLSLFFNDIILFWFVFPGASSRNRLVTIKVENESVPEPSQSTIVSTFVDSTTSRQAEDYSKFTKKFKKLFSHRCPEGSILVIAPGDPSFIPG